MTDEYAWLTIWLTTLSAQTPTLLALLAIGGCVAAGWKRLGPAAPWALLGFGLLLLDILAASSTQLLVIYWTQHAHVSIQEVGMRTMILSVGLSCLHALALVFVAIAVFAGRRNVGAVPPPLPVQNPDATSFDGRL